jgi:hypothetical protein
MSFRETLGNLAHKASDSAKIASSAAHSGVSRIKSRGSDGETEDQVSVRKAVKQAAIERKEELRKENIERLKTEGQNRQEEWSASEKLREDKQHKEEIRLANFANVREERKYKAEIAQHRSKESKANKVRRDSSLAASYLKNRSKKSEKNKDREYKLRIASLKAEKSRNTVQTRGLNPRSGTENLKQLTMPGVQSVGSTSFRNPMGDLSNLRNLQLGVKLPGMAKNPKTPKLNTNQTNVFLAMQGGITENKEISNLTSMPIMQVARAKVGLKSKGLIKA